MEEKLILPEGLPVAPGGPEKVREILSGIWPVSELDSSIGSIILTLCILLGFVAGLVILSFLAKTFLPKILNKIGQYLCLLLAGAVVFAGFFTVQGWQSEAPITDKAMGVAVTKTSSWLAVQGVSTDNRGVWDLVCTYYDDKNSHCRSVNPEIFYKGQKKQVRLEADSQGNLYLYDFANRIPLGQ